MGLIVPILRVAMLLLNIYETFKVLKLPRPSPRNSGQPTIRALSQRKRNMKGCLAVWIVWCCFMVYERMAEGIVSLFIPFYDEFKSLVLLFLILTRARGAEPIFLHVIRPLLRPYTSTLDAFSDVGRMFGDIIFLLMAYPFRLVSSWWHDMFASQDRAGGGLYSEVQQALHSVSHPISAAGRRRSSGPLRPDVQPRAPEPNVPPPPYMPTAPTVAMPVPVHTVHEVWHPPRSAYHDDEDYLDPAPMSSPWEADDARRAREQQDEWRQYPAFPSAYPPTPLPAHASQLPSFAPRQFSPIPEDAQPGQDFGQSLPSPHELPNPGSAKDSSDDDNTLGIQSGSSNAFQDDTMDEDEEEEDDFDVTLRTPGSLVVPDTVVARMTRSRTKSSQPPAGPTLVALPSLLSRIASDTSSVSSDSSTSSLLGRKRSREIVAPTVGGRNASKRRYAPAINDPQAMSEDESSEASSPSPSGGEENTEEDTEADSGVSEHSPLSKKRRVASPPSRVQPRRTTRTTSREPPGVPPPALAAARRKTQRQPKSQAPAAAVGRASSRQGTAAAAAVLDGPTEAPKAARSSRRAGAGTVTAKRK
ncbi:hypothetical protein C8R47DRAFT_1128391 [Mycena vitilis]|nr:hypothetical protein C8R47DRAFT_1128391 [Mycena vitilis]